jgi:hypothetical protein
VRVNGVVERDVFFGHAASDAAASGALGKAGSRHAEADDPRFPYDHRVAARNLVEQRKTRKITGRAEPSQLLGGF